ncbi:MFS general substrate transporter [Mycena pura]|uniref:MFS general substrate transporter n=1 Tax=Mycena pura TaxID=153505 RepID=A0AAD6YT02_9AGAR|nr:MFS general substrate transporter [Mycena pura]
MSLLEKGHSGSDLNNELSPKQSSPERHALEKKLLRKIDARMSILVVIYILNYIDRNNAAAARNRGLTADLRLSGQEFPTLLSILYVGYIIMQIPSNMLLNWMARPSLYLPSAMIIWGIISSLTGAVFCFFQESLKSRTLSSPLHLFWVTEGSLTVFVAILAIFILPDFPTTSKWLTPEEHELALLRMTEDAGVGDQNETETGGPLHGLRLALLDWRVWWLALALTAQVVALSFNAFFPTLTMTLGFSPTVTLLLCAPPFAIAALAAFLLARERCFHMVSSFGLGVVGFVIAISTMNTAARYIALFLMAQSYAGFVVMYAWMSNSFPRPPSKRAVALALMNAFSQLGNVAVTRYVWPSNWGPTYRNSYAICIACSGTTIVMCLLFRWSLIHANRKLDREEEEQGVKKRGFRYIL